MRRFIITSAKFFGEAELIYNIDGLLNMINLSNTDMTAEQVNVIKRDCPLTITHLLAGGHNLPKQLTILEKEFDVTFEMFWKAYPYKRNRHLAEAYWPRMNKTDQVLAWQAAIEYSLYAIKNKDWYNPKIADLWLKKKEFLNDWKKL